MTLVGILIAEPTKKEKMKIDFEDKYHSLENKHFWFKARRNYILQLLKKHPRNIKILDIGCSSGILLKNLEKIGFKIENLYGIDISPTAIKNCKKNGIINAFVMDAQKITLNERFDVIIASDCLEHLENDSKALDNWYSLLKDNGYAYIFVPAFMFLWSIHDKVNMHFRKYKKRELKNKLIENNFEINKSSYWNFFMFIPIFIVRQLGKLKKQKKATVNGDLKEIPLLNGLLLYLIYFENWMLRFISLPFGVSTFCIAKKNFFKTKKRIKLYVKLRFF